MGSCRVWIIKMMMMMMMTDLADHRRVERSLKLVIFCTLIGFDIYILLLITRSLAWHLLILGKLTRWKWWLLWLCAVVTKTTDPVNPSFPQTPGPLRPGTSAPRIPHPASRIPHPGPVLSTKSYLHVNCVNFPKNRLAREKKKGDSFPKVMRIYEM